MSVWKVKARPLKEKYSYLFSGGATSGDQVNVRARRRATGGASASSRHLAKPARAWGVPTLPHPPSKRVIHTEQHCRRKSSGLEVQWDFLSTVLLHTVLLKASRNHYKLFYPKYSFQNPRKIADLCCCEFGNTVYKCLPQNFLILAYFLTTTTNGH